MLGKCGACFWGVEVRARELGRAPVESRRGGNAERGEGRREESEEADLDGRRGILVADHGIVDKGFNGLFHLMQKWEAPSIGL